MLALQELEHDAKDFLFKEYAEPYLKQTAIKSLAICKKEARLQIEDSLEQFKKDLAKGTELLLRSALPNERNELEKIFEKIHTQFEDKSNTPVEFHAKDAVFLETIANRELQHGDIQVANHLFRFIIALMPYYNRAWVGYMISLLKSGDAPNAEAVLSMAMKLFPNDPFTHIYAAQFYIINHDKTKAKKILKAISDHLAILPEKDPEDLLKIQELLKLVS